MWLHGDDAVPPTASSANKRRARGTAAMIVEYGGAVPDCQCYVPTFHFNLRYANIFFAAVHRHRRLKRSNLRLATTISTIMSSSPLTFAALVLLCGVLSGAAAGGGAVLPTAPQLRWQMNDTGCFVHYNMATMAGSQGCQAGTNVPPPLSAWQPTALDTDSWVKTCAAMGGTRIIYVAKHGCGFAAWKSKTASRFPPPLPPPPPPPHTHTSTDW